MKKFNQVVSHYFIGVFFFRIFCKSIIFFCIFFFKKKIIETITKKRSSWTQKEKPMRVLGFDPKQIQNSLNSKGSSYPPSIRKTVARKRERLLFGASWCRGGKLWRTPGSRPIKGTRSPFLFLPLCVFDRNEKQDLGPEKVKAQLRERLHFQQIFPAMSWLIALLYYHKWYKTNCRRVKYCAAEAVQCTEYWGAEQLTWSQTNE